MLAVSLATTGAAVSLAAGFADPAGFAAAFSTVGFAAAEGFGATGFAAGAPAPGLARAAAKISAMLMPLPPGATFVAGAEDAATAAGASAPVPSAAVPDAASESGAAVEGAGDETPALFFSARAAASISSTDSFLAMIVVLLVNPLATQKLFPDQKIQRIRRRRVGLVIFFTNYRICICLTTYVNYPVCWNWPAGQRASWQTSRRGTRKINALVLHWLAGAVASKMTVACYGISRERLTERLTTLASAQRLRPFAAHISSSHRSRTTPGCPLPDADGTGRARWSAP